MSGVVLARAKREARAATFWKDEPAPPEPPPALPPAPSTGVLAWSLPLAPGVTLMVTPARAPTDADAETLTRAAAPLVAELVRRGMIATAEEDEED